MIYCNLKGGLGNMLFQIATAKSIAIDKNVDCSYPNLFAQYELINIDNYYNPVIKHGYEYHELFSNLNHVSPSVEMPIISFPFHYEKIETPQDNFYIDGFFQSEKYFLHNRDAILEYLAVPKKVMDVINKKYINLLDQRTTSIHVRRGDYLKLPNHHPVQSLEYYKLCIELMENQTDAFIIFSDDIEWCKNNLGLGNAVYIEKEKDYVELFLMSMCDNNILSNSSFSWWGAWLSKKENKTVIGPKKWFGPAMLHKTSDILSEKWIKI